MGALRGQADGIYWNSAPCDGGPKLHEPLEPYPMAIFHNPSFCERGTPSEPATRGRSHQPLKPRFWRGLGHYNLRTIIQSEVVFGRTDPKSAAFTLADPTAFSLGARRASSTEILSSARARWTQHLARGHPPLAAVGPRLGRTGPGDRPRFGGANGEPIAFRRGCGIRVPAGSNAHHRRRPFVGIGGKRRRHGGADGERDEAPCEPGYGHLTHPQPPPVARQARSRVLCPLVAAAQQKVHARGVFPNVHRRRRFRVIDHGPGGTGRIGQYRGRQLRRPLDRLSYN